MRRKAPPHHHDDDQHRTGGHHIASRPKADAMAQGITDPAPPGGKWERVGRRPTPLGRPHAVAEMHRHPTQQLATPDRGIRAASRPKADATSSGTPTRRRPTIGRSTRARQEG